MSYLKLSDASVGLLDLDGNRKTGLELREKYKNAKPFPHIAIDDFLPGEILEMCLSQFPTVLGTDSQTFDRPQERLKSSFNPDHLSSQLRIFFYSFNSRPFIKVVENITGINGLIPDPYYLGGGFHEIKNGGHLSVHADFNHHKVMNLERRLNVLIYLNKDWENEYGGQLELWDDGMNKCVQSYIPMFNRCVIFTTTSNSNHGNPQPVNHPQGIARRSIALYYYTSTWSEEKRDHTTQFKIRPQSKDEADGEVRNSELMRDLLPPILYRNFIRLKRRKY